MHLAQQPVIQIRQAVGRRYRAMHEDFAWLEDIRRRQCYGVLAVERKIEHA